MSKETPPPGHLCEDIGIGQPTAEHECRQAVWSQGRRCRMCRVDCYRQGWTHGAVAVDNKQRVADKLARRAKAR